MVGDRFDCVWWWEERCYAREAGGLLVAIRARLGEGARFGRKERKERVARFEIEIGEQLRRALQSSLGGEKMVRVESSRAFVCRVVMEGR